MANKLGKTKTKKSVAKRFKMTGTGKMVRRKQGRRHLLIKKNAKRKRKLGQSTLVDASDLPRLKRCMPYA